MASLYTSVLVSWVLQLFCLTHSAVFLQEHEANDLLRRDRRANSLFEEIKRGSIERECFEEQCSREEAREVFENEPRTEEFWTKFTEGDQCSSNPCLNGGTCEDQFNRYQCWCTENFEGSNCEIERIIKMKCTFENGHCMQFCTDVANSSRDCSCAMDYRLAEDEVSCISKVQYPCGKVPRWNYYVELGITDETERSRIVGGKIALKGQSPWQMILTFKGTFICGGVLVSPQWVVTAAHCTNDKEAEDLQVVAGDHVLNEDEDTEQKRNVLEKIQHKNYNPQTINNDIAMLKLDAPITLDDYVVPICLPEPGFVVRELRQIKYSTVSGWGKQWEAGLQANTLQTLQVPMVWPSECRHTTNYNITNNMFCAGYKEANKDTCKGDSGGPHVTNYKGTWFLTGIVSWGEGCARAGKYGIYTKVHKYFSWIEQLLNAPSPRVSAESYANLTGSVSPTANVSYQLLKPLASTINRGQERQKLGNTIPGIFLDNGKANHFLTRQRRENSFFEELKEGNLERECIEERCSKEEAREYFENDQRTDEFWNKYVDGNQCESNPCKNRGRCRDGINQYQCNCTQGFRGNNCEIEIPKLCSLYNGGCQHYCRVQQDQVKCSCDEDFLLAADGKLCIPAVRNPCGTIGNFNTEFINDSVPSNSSMVNDTNDDSDNTERNVPDPRDVVRIVGGQECPLGQCPWQILLVDEAGMGFCGATILNKWFVLTAAHCLNQTKNIIVVAGEFDVNMAEGTEQQRDVLMIVPHSYFQRHTFDNDIAIIMLKKPLQLNRNVVPICLPQRNFAEKVLMNEKTAIVSGWGRVQNHGVPSTKLQQLAVPYVDRIKCIESSRYSVSSNMFCAGYKTITKDACQGDSGGPHVTEHKGTWFLTGVVSWGEGCAQKGKYGMYTKVSKYVKWIKRAMDEMMCFAPIKQTDS
ncbi:uncharacterized protein LOC144598439 [Rhinoraja longicauda]